MGTLRQYALAEGSNWTNDPRPGGYNLLHTHRDPQSGPSVPDGALHGRRGSPLLRRSRALVYTPAHPGLPYRSTFRIYPPKITALQGNCNYRSTGREAASAQTNGKRH